MGNRKGSKNTRKTIAHYLGKFLQTGFGFSELMKTPDEQLKELSGLNKPLVSDDADPRKVHFDSQVDCFKKELLSIGVTHLVLWDEYVKEYPQGFQYSRFCELLQDQLKLNNEVMTFVHYPGKLV